MSDNRIAAFVGLTAGTIVDAMILSFRLFATEQSMSKGYQVAACLAAWLFVGWLVYFATWERA